MAEPWSNDFAALAERSRAGLPTLDATRAALSTRSQETSRMRFFKNHPALAALIALAVLGAASGAAYAVVREVWVTVDPSQSAPEIEHSVQSQLDQQGVPALVYADKSDDGKLMIAIKSQGEGAGSDLHVNLAGLPDGGTRRTLSIEGELDDAAGMALAQVTSSPEMIAVLKADYPSDDALAAAIRQVLVAHGFTNLDVHVDGDEIHIIVKS